MGWHIKQVQRVIDTAARAVLPVWRTTPSNTLCRDASLPTAGIALEEIRLRFALRLHSVDRKHPLVPRMRVPIIPRGPRTGSPYRAYTKIQRAALGWGGFPRPLLVRDRYTQGCRQDPTGSKTKQEATSAFNSWYAQVPEQDLIVFSDGSQDRAQLGYGYVILNPKSQAPIAQGNGSLHTCGVVFDAEAIGAWRGLEHAIRIAEHNTNITICVDNTATIWCLRGSASATSQWAFLSFHKAVSQWQGNINVRWSPGHMGIHGNELADKLAKDGLKAPMDPRSGPTLAGIRAEIRRNLRGIRRHSWEQVKATLSARYNAWKLPYDPLNHQTELEVLTRVQLSYYLAIRTGHGDFAWYHRKFNHENAEIHCTCGYSKTPEHIVMCRKVQGSYSKWPWPGERPRHKPQTRREKIEYLRELMAHPPAFQEYLDTTGYYTKVCPRHRQQ